MPDKAQEQPVADNPPAFVYWRNGAMLALPETMQPREIIVVVKELERMALEDYLRRTADGGGT